MAGAASELGGEVLDRLLGERLLRQAQQDGLAGLGGLHRGDEGHLVLRAAAGLAARTLAAEVGVVDLDPAGELAPLLAQRMASMSLCLISQAVG